MESVHTYVVAARVDFCGLQIDARAISTKCSRNNSILSPTYPHVAAGN